MRLDRFTQKSRAAIEAAASLAASRKHAQVTPQHLLAILLEQDDSLVPRILKRIGASPETVRGDVNAALAKQPTLSSVAEPTTDPDLMAVLRAAEHETREMQDEYISTEHLLLSLAGHNSPAGRGAAQRRGDKAAVAEAIASVRGPHRVTDDNPEDKYEALAKFGNDLTDAAEPPAGSTRSSAATTRSAASSRSSRAARRTTPC